MISTEMEVSLSIYIFVKREKTGYTYENSNRQSRRSKTQSRSGTENSISKIERE